MNPLATWVVGAACAGGLTAGAVSIAATSSSPSSDAVAASSASSTVAHLKSVKHQLQRELRAAVPVTAAPVPQAPTTIPQTVRTNVTPATWVQVPQPTATAPATTTTTPAPTTPTTTTTTVPPARWVDDGGGAGRSDDVGESTGPGGGHDD